MLITFLGTGTSQGVPMIGCECAVCTSGDPKDKRLRSSILVQSGQTNVVVDAGPDFRQQMLRQALKKLDAVLFTHEHKDHIAGLDDVRAFNYLSGSGMDVFATVKVQEALRREFFYVFSNHTYPGIPKLNLKTIDNKPFSIGDIPVLPIEVKHMQLPVLGFRFNEFTYITDANYIDEAEKEKIKGTRYLVLNALRKEKHPSHFTLNEALALIEEIRPEKTWLTHLSHQMGKHADVNSQLPKGVECAFDGLQIEF
ncbi:MAG: MBL fold metallo-hydrolase [Bacteroidetes bacterium]|nr:MAG: MBL fold metallo-hydrolase [Bacteroidota bacterium]